MKGDKGGGGGGNRGRAVSGSRSDCVFALVCETTLFLTRRSLWDDYRSVCVKPRCFKTAIQCDKQTGVEFELRRVRGGRVGGGQVLIDGRHCLYKSLSVRLAH